MASSCLPTTTASSSRRGSRVDLFRDESVSETDSLLERSQRKVKRLWEGFIDFAFQGNILQIAFGLM